MTKQEQSRIQTWIEAIESEIKAIKDVKRYYKEDKRMLSYFEGKEKAYNDALNSFEFFMGKWKKCKWE